MERKIYLIENIKIKGPKNYFFESGWQMGAWKSFADWDHAKKWDSLKTCRKAIRYYINDIDRRIKRYDQTQYSYRISDLENEKERFFNEFQVVSFSIQEEPDDIINTQTLYSKSITSDVLVGKDKALKIQAMKTANEPVKQDIIDGI